MNERIKELIKDAWDYDTNSLDEEMTKELLSAIYMTYMDRNGYAHQPWDLDANWSYWMKDGGQGRFSWLWYLVHNENKSS